MRVVSHVHFIHNFVDVHVRAKGETITCNYRNNNFSNKDLTLTSQLTQVYTCLGQDDQYYSTQALKISKLVVLAEPRTSGK